MTQNTPQPLAPMHGGYDYRDDEISLYDLWAILQRRRYTIGVVMLAVILATSAYALSRTPTYLLDSVLSVGTMPTVNANSVRSIEAPSQLASRLNEVVIPALISARKLEEDAKPESARQSWPSPEATVVSDEAGLVSLSIEIPEARFQSMVALFGALNRQIITEHSRRLEWKRNQLSERIAMKKRELAQAGDEASEIRNRILALDGDNQTVTAALSGLIQLVVARESNNDIAGLEAKLAQFESIQQSLESTVVARPPRLADTPEGQPLGTLLGLGAVLGLMLGIFAAFGREFVANASTQSESISDE